MQLIAQIGLLSPAKYSANNNNYLCNICAAHFTFSMGHAASTLAMGQAFSAHTRAHSNTLTHTRMGALDTEFTYVCCIFVVAAVLAGFVNRKIDFIYTCVCVCIYILCVSVYFMYVCTHSHSLRRKTTFREYYTHSRALTLTQRHRHGHWQRLTPAAAQRFDGPKNNNKNNNEQYADRAELQNGSARRKVKNTTETSLGKKYFYSTLGSARRRHAQ